MDKFTHFRKLYETFIYEGFSLIEKENTTIITYDFHVPKLTHYYPSIEIPKFKNNDFSSYIIFHIGLIELISYWKATCSPKVIIKAGYINEEQISFFKKLYYFGLGELFYTNGIKTNYKDFMNITCVIEKQTINIPIYNGTGNLIPIGGGKDSNVTLEILKKMYQENTAFIINPKEITLNCAKISGYENNKLITVKRTIDSNLIKLNKQGFINGHTPFSALVAFISYLCAYNNNNKYIILSNESSANESNIEGTKINHQYSKTYEFENDFNNYTKKYFKIDIKYFSLLRPLTEYQIGMLFSKYEQYHQIFKSCNIGSKKTPWKWCCNCPKCLFVYIILSPFLYKEKLINIFGQDLYEKKELLNTLIELSGNGKIKPFECVGTYEEVRYALTKIIKRTKDLPLLLKYYKDNYTLEDLSLKLEKKFNKENNLDEKFISLLKEELNKYDR